MVTPAEWTSGRRGSPPKLALSAGDENGPGPRELDHRMANSLQLAADFLLLQWTRVRDPIARMALLDAAERLVAVGHLHRFLCDHASAGEVDLRPFLEELAALIGQGTGLNCVAEADSILAPGELAQQLGLAVNELAINAAKHAYGRGAPGELMIRARREGERLRLTVSDHGVGLGEGFHVDRSPGIGMGIVQAIARQLRATFEATSDGGACFTLLAPLPPRPGPPSRSFAPTEAGDA